MPDGSSPDLEARAPRHDASARRLTHTSGTTKNPVASAKPHSSEIARAARVAWPDSFGCMRCHLRSMPIVVCRSALGRERFTGDTRSRPSALLQRPALPAAGPQTTISPPPHRLVAMPAHSSATPVKISRPLLPVSDTTGLVDLHRAPPPPGPP